jgi:hypothetical protein
MATFGNLFLRPSPDSLAADFKSKLEAPEMLRYFPEARERQQISVSLGQRIHRKHFQGPLTNEATLAAMGEGGKELVGTIIRRALEVEGVRVEANRNQWANRILAPFNTCLGRARSITEGQRCLLALERSAVPNVGLAVAFELNFQEFGAATAEVRAREFRQCLRPNAPGAQDRLKSCVVTGVRKSVVEKAREALLAVVSQSAPQRSDAILQSQIPKLERCLANANERAQFSECADQMAIDSGTDLSQAVVLSHPDLQRILPSENDRRAVATEAATIFRNCMIENRRKNLRNQQSGTLETKNCEAAVKTGAIRSGGLALFRKTIGEQIPESTVRSRLAQESTRKLDSCWKPDKDIDQNTGCLRSAIIDLAKQIAAHQLTREIPNSLQAAQPQLRASLITSLTTCLEREIPANVTSSDRTEPAINNCTGALIRSTAAQVAEHGIRVAIGPHSLPTAVTNRIVEEIVTEGLLKCLGTNPSRQKINQCALETKRTAAGTIGETLLRNEWNKFVREKGLSPSPEEETKVLESALTPLRKCLRERTLELRSVDQEIDQCIKESIPPFALNLARIETTRALEKSGVSADQAPQQQSQVAQGLSSCLNEKMARSFSLEAFMAHLNTCKERVASQAIREIGQSQILRAIDLSLPVTEPSLHETRNRVRGILMSKLDACAGHRMTDLERESCLQGLQTEAFSLLVPEAGSYQARKNLRQNNLPSEITSLEKDFRECIGRRAQTPDQCGRIYTIQLASKVASLKLRRTMNDLLGVSQISRFSAEITRMEERFKGCLSQIDGHKMDDKFLRAVESCSKVLEEDGLVFAQTRLREWINNRPSANETEQLIRDRLALAIPCLEPVLPIVEFDPSRGLPAEGILQAVSGVISEYLAYDSERAKDDIGTLFQSLAQDLASAGPERARLALLENLSRSGSLDQFLKSMVRAEVRKLFQSLPPSDRIPDALANTLLSRATIDQTLTPAILAELRPTLLEKILKPMLLAGKSMDSPDLALAISALQRELGTRLIASNSFGDTLVRGVIQNNVRSQTSGLIGNLATHWYGMRTTNWEQARLNPNGRQAEEFMKEQILQPMIRGESLPTAEQNRRRRALENLVFEALKAR